MDKLNLQLKFVSNILIFIRIAICLLFYIFSGDHYDVILYSEKMLKVLGNIWFNTKSVDAVIKILQKICESNPNHLDATGVFLLKIVKLCNSSETMDDLLKLLKVIYKFHLINLV